MQVDYSSAWSQTSGGGSAGGVLYADASIQSARTPGLTFIMGQVRDPSPGLDPAPRSGDSGGWGRPRTVRIGQVNGYLYGRNESGKEERLFVIPTNRGYLGRDLRRQRPGVCRRTGSLQRVDRAPPLPGRYRPGRRSPRGGFCRIARRGLGDALRSAPEDRAGYQREQRRSSK